MFYGLHTESMISLSCECRMNRTDARDESGKRIARENGEGTDEVPVGRDFTPQGKALAHGQRLAFTFEQVERGTFRERASGRGFDLTAFGARDHDGEIRVNELEEAVAFDQNSGGLYTFERRLDSLFDLTVGHNHPVDVRRPRVPVPPRVFPRSVSLRAPRTNHRLVAEQVAHAARVRVFAARAVVPARHLDRLPAGEGAQQFTQQRRLADLRGKAADGDSDGTHFL